MDDADKTQRRGGQVSSQQQPPIQNQPQPQAGGAGTIVKEQEPVNSASQTESNVLEFIEPSGAERKLEVRPELEKMRVKSVSETPELDIHAKKAGVSHAGESVPVLQQISKISQLRNELEIERASKQDTDKSIRWLWEEVQKMFKRS